MGCQPGDFAYDHFNLPPGFVYMLGIYGLTYSLFTQRGDGNDFNNDDDSDNYDDIGTINDYIFGYDDNDDYSDCNDA